jgi:heavy metal sensor kinase
MLIVGLTLGIFSATVYNTFSTILYEDIDDLLDSKAGGIAAAINAYWEAQKQEAVKEGVKAEVFAKADNINFAKIAQSLVEDKEEGSRITQAVTLVYDGQGKAIASSQAMPQVVFLSKDLLDYISDGEDSYDNLKIKIDTTKSRLYRVYTLPVMEEGRPAYIIQVATQLGQVYSALGKLKVIIFIFLPLTVILSGIAGIFLVKVALRPVNSMIRTIRQITAENLKMRVNIPDTKDEIKKLADTFNEMLLKLDETISAERSFIQDISHELKTPLTILKGQLEVTLKNIRSQEEYESVLYSSLEEIDRISKIVDNLLILARLDNKEMSLSMQPLELGLLLKEVANDVDILAKQKNIQVNYNRLDNVSVMADPSYLKRLFLNILDNAIKYTPQGGRIYLAINKNSTFAKVDVRDTGIGIPQEELPHVFDRFYRTSKAQEKRGFGLGLAIAQSIILAHKGKIEVTSIPSRGTTFSIYLPAST